MNKKLELILSDQKFIFVGDYTDPSTIIEYELAKGKIGKNTLTSVDGKDYVFFADLCWPICAKTQLIEIVTKRQQLKKALDDSFILVYKLGNSITLGELSS